MTEHSFDPDHLGHLLLEFGEDYTDDYGDDEALAFAAFIAGGNRERTQGAFEGLTRLNYECPTEEDLETALVEAGLGIYRGGSSTPYKDFVGRLITWLTEALADPESQQRPQA